MPPSFFGMADSFYFASGYMSPAVVLSLLGDRFDTVLIDDLAHYCLDEAAAKLGCPVERFEHCSVDALATKLESEAAAGHKVVVMTDGVFSALGRLAPVAEYWQLLAAHPGSMLLVDDAPRLRGSRRAWSRRSGTMPDFGARKSTPDCRLATTKNRPCGRAGR